MTRLSSITPDWPVPARVGAASTTRAGGVSLRPWGALNLGARTEDDPAAVDANRARLVSALDLPEPPRWLHQVHGTRVVHADEVVRDETRADAIWADRPGAVCAVLTADCLPVLFASESGTCVAAAHAGWRGLAAGVLEATVAALPAAPGALHAWLGPAIGPEDFEVGDEVRSAFLAADPQAETCFRPSPAGRWLADLYGLAGRRLRATGVTSVHGGGWSTFSDVARFHSHRRDSRSGRMASLIWVKS